MEAMWAVESMESMSARKAGVGPVDGGQSARYECSTRRRHTQPLLPLRYRHAFRVASEAQTAHTILQRRHHPMRQSATYNL